jgi:outer membrane lipoprotein-sorting protein
MILFAVSAATAMDKDKLYSELKKKYGNIESAMFDYRSRQNPQMHGRMVIKKGNMFRIEVPGRLIISNGETVWNYSLGDNNVMISKYEEMPDNASMERIFFDMMDNFEPVKLFSESTNKGTKLMKLEMKAGGENDLNVNDLFIFVDPNTTEIVSIGVYNDFGGDTWDLANIRTNIDLPKSEFNFKAPEEAEVIDLR